MDRVKKQEYRKAYKEVTTILDVLDFRLRRLIPQEKIEFYKRNLDPNHNFKFDYSKRINEQEILYPTRCIIANLFKNYIALEKDKKRIIEREKQEIKILREKRTLNNNF